MVQRYGSILDVLWYRELRNWSCPRLTIDMEISVCLPALVLTESPNLLLTRYLFCGSWTILWALVMLAFVPHSPERPGKWFTAEEKVLLKRRLALNMTGKDQTSLKRDQMVEALVDTKLWIFLLIAAALYVTNGGVTAVSGSLCQNCAKMFTEF